MTQYYEVLRYTEYKERTTWLSEREKLSKNLEALHQTSERLAARRTELSKLFEEVQSNLADSRSLRVKLNNTASEIGLALIPPSEIRI